MTRGVDTSTGRGVEPSSANAAGMARMVASRDRTRAELATIVAAIHAAAKRATRNADGLPPTFGRGASDWTARHEQHFQAERRALEAARRRETGALRTKLERQNAAIREAIARRTTAKASRNTAK